MIGYIAMVESVYDTVRTDSLYKVRLRLVFKRLKTLLTVTPPHILMDMRFIYIKFRDK